LTSSLRERLSDLGPEAKLIAQYRAPQRRSGFLPHPELQISTESRAVAVRIVAEMDGVL